MKYKTRSHLKNTGATQKSLGSVFHTFHIDLGLWWMRRARKLCVGIQFVSLACQLRADTLARPRETLLDLLLQLHVAEVDHVNVDAGAPSRSSKKAR